MGASQFLQELDANPEIGSLYALRHQSIFKAKFDAQPLDRIDCTSNYEIEADQAKKISGVDLSPERKCTAGVRATLLKGPSLVWLVKLLLGPIDSSYDVSLLIYLRLQADRPFTEQG